MSHNYYLVHQGVSILNGAPGLGSGRYPLGFGDRPYQRRKEKAKKIAVSALKMTGKILASVAISYASTYFVGKLGLAAMNAIVNRPSLSEISIIEHSQKISEITKNGFSAINKVFSGSVDNIESLASGYANVWKRVLNDRQIALNK